MPIQMSYEFYIYEGELWLRDSDGHSELVDASKTDLLNKVLDKVKEDYPAAYEALRERYKDSSPNKIYYKYLMAVRFIRCNFGVLDSTFLDIQEDRFNFERISCPIRSECKYDGIICSPTFNTSLYKIELKVCELWYKGMTKEEIGGILYLSPYTVNNHIRNAYAKVGCHEKSEFVKFVEAHNLFR